eukprot:PITA_11657
MAHTPDKYRLIALCNVVYKIISKVVANRLKPFLPVLVSGEKSGYVEGRQILDNIIQAQEVVHSLTSKKQVGMIMQLDIAKAYDKVNWVYLRKMLIAFRFDHSWVRWVMALVTSSSFSILVNGTPSGIFSPSRGLRQGDPLSPFLFIIMMEGLGRAIKQVKYSGKIKGLQLTDNGMEVNLSKSKIFFFNTNIAVQKNISRILGFQRDFLPSKYLGVLLTAKPMLKSIWEPLINKLQDKVSTWTIKYLNLAGKLVLTKAVLQAIPISMLSALPAPKGVLQQFRNIQRNFLWDKEETERKWALVSWDKICKPKKHGGLGFDDQEILSKALGAKIWWHWVYHPETQWENIWKEKYANSWQNNDLIRMSGNIKGSYIWNKAWENKRLVQEYSLWEIREGNLALFWEDNWEQEPILAKEDFLGLKQELDSQGLIKVKDFLIHSNPTDKWRTWKNIECRNSSLLKTRAEELRKIVEKRKILVAEGQDQLRWGNNKEGTFILKEAKKHSPLDPGVPNKIWQKLWRHQGWMKIKLYMWVVYHKKILTWDKIRKRGVQGPSRCPLCEAQE